MNGPDVWPTTHEPLKQWPPGTTVDADGVVHVGNGAVDSYDVLRGHYPPADTLPRQNPADPRWAAHDRDVTPEQADRLCGVPT